eukprot:TRINITY_DN14319_c0_g1_i1.p4 TRINITY_DN14319_c0_g1~~TRINITY_DN14319_c0_g1_i1.p4  ORF type:complete len:104 (+),score=1.11 TRINITY_DN14319_c0_g1_i1:175-486(+)
MKILIRQQGKAFCCRFQKNLQNNHIQFYLGVQRTNQQDLGRQRKFGLCQCGSQQNQPSNEQANSKNEGDAQSGESERDLFIPIMVGIALLGYGITSLLAILEY